MKIFLIGPGGVGKSSVGRILSSLLGTEFTDLDEEFCSRINNVRSYIDIHGYDKYCIENSKLFYDILNMLNGDFIFALSSGFLAYKNFPDLIRNHKRTIEKIGTSILILPSSSLSECRDIIVKRQLNEHCRFVTISISKI